MTDQTRTRLTYAAARSIVWGRLRAAGWAVDTSRVMPRALCRQHRGNVALFFKPQAVYLATVRRGTPTRDAAGSTGEDIRVWADMDAAAMLAHIGALADRDHDRHFVAAYGAAQ